MTTQVIVSAADISLMQVAARELGNALQWWQIAQLNGLSDWDLSGLAAPVVLVLPAPDLAALDGVPSQ